MSRSSRRVVRRKRTPDTHDVTPAPQPTVAPSVATTVADSARGGIDLADQTSPTGEIIDAALAEPSLGHAFGSIRVSSPRGAAAPGMPNAPGDGVSANAMRAASLSKAEPLPAELRSRFETSLSRDLTGVRLHTDADSAEAARLLGARAFTLGPDVYVGSGRYDPGSTEGARLLAHEVAHTVQQRAPSSSHAPDHGIAVGPRDGLAERQADTAALAMVAGSPEGANVVHEGMFAQPLVQREPDDPDVDKLPSAPAFAPATQGFSKLASAVAEATRGGKKALPSPDGEFNASTSNLNAFVDHAGSSHTYHAHRAPEEPKDKGSSTDAILTGLKNFALKDSTAGVLAKNDLADMTWGQNLVAEVSVARAATSSWLPVLSRGNDSWASLVDSAKALNIEVFNKAPSPLAKLAPGAEAPPGAQQVNTSDVFGEGNALAGLARKAGMKQGPNTTKLRDAMADYQTSREKVANASRGVVSTLFDARKEATAGLKAAAEQDKEAWEAYKLAVDAFATGLQAALGAEAELAGEKMSLEGEGKAKVVEGKDGNPAKMEGVPETPDAKAAVGAATKGITMLIDMKIKKIDTTINSYTARASTWNAVIQKQMDLKHVGDYKTALGEQRKLAKRVEDEQEALEKALVEWAREIDQRLEAQGKTPKGSKEAEQSAALLGKIRVAKVDVDGAVEAMSGGGTAALSMLYENIHKEVSTRKEDQTAGNGRTDPRSRLFAIETSRWANAKGSLTSVEGSLKERQTNLTELETNFLATLVQTGAPTSGSLIGPKY